VAGSGQAAGRVISSALVSIFIAFLFVLIFSRVGCANHHTPPGHEGYIRSKPIAGAGKFVGIQRGPTSTGWVWRQEVVNIDVRPRTYTEEMSIITAERLSLSLRAHVRVRLRAGSVKDVVEKYGGADWYKSNVREQFRSEVRAQVQSLDAFSVKNRSREISAGVMKVMQERYKDTPVEFLSVDVGDITYPDVVVQSVIRKFVTNEDNERKNIELEIAQKEIDIGIAEAEGVADAQRVIRTTLDPMFLQYEALGAIESMSQTPNTTFVVVPFSKEGAPMIMNLQ
jgi:hypothetical protein